MLAARALLETPGASNLRKAQVRAALFRKQEPILAGKQQFDIASPVNGTPVSVCSTVELMCDMSE